MVFWKLKRNKIKYKYIGIIKNMFKIRYELIIEEYKVNKMLRELWYIVYKLRFFLNLKFYKIKLIYLFILKKRILVL